MKKALIIFVRNPERGKVKTRLAKEIGEERALRVYLELLQHTCQVTISLDCDKFVYYDTHIGQNDIWTDKIFNKRLQTGDSLGDRMQIAFRELFLLGYSKVMIIGSDCPGLNASIMEEAFEKLFSSDVVFGPASDGGYYLLGMTQLVSALFENKKWSTAAVLAESIRDAIDYRKSFSLLPELSDIDTANDLLRYPRLQSV